MNNYIAVIYILLGGFAGALQARVLGNIETKIGILGNMLINFLLGLFFSLLIISIYSWVQYQNPIKYYTTLSLGGIKTWEMSAGIFGIIIVTSIGLAASRIGVSGTLLLFFFSQILLGMIIDHFGFLGGEVFALTPSKLVGIAIMGLGVYLFFH